MALEKFRECLVMDNSYYKSFDKPPEAMKESYNKVISQRLTESQDSKSLIKEAEALREKASPENRDIFDRIITKLKEQGVSSTKKLWKFPISRINTAESKNGNGRVYGKKLWENVINNQQDIWKGGIGLCDHPVADDDAGEFKNTAIVWLGMELDELNKLVYGLGVFVGTLGQLAQEVIEAGGRVGFSSSGFGELMSDGFTVNPDTYQIERVADIVTNPSQGVFGNLSSESSPLSEPIKTDTLVIEKKPVLENMEPQSKIIKENKVAIETLKENTSSSNKTLTGLEKLAIEKYVENYQKDISEIKNPVERLNEINKLLETVNESGDASLKEKVEKQLQENKAEVEKLVDDAIKLQESFQSSLPEVEKGVKNLIINESNAKQENDKKFRSYKKLSEELTARNRTLRKENTILKTKLAMREKNLNEDSVSKDMNFVSLNMQISDLEEALENAEKTIQEKSQENRNLGKSNAVLSEKCDKLKNAFAGSTEEAKSRIASMAETIKSLKKTIEENKQLISDKDKLLRDSRRLINTLKEDNSRLQNKVNVLKEQNEKAEKDFNEFKENQKMENHIVPSKSEMMLSNAFFRENGGREVEKYWEDLKSIYGDRILPFEKEIRRAKTYKEAFNAFLKNKDSIDESFGRVKESTIAPEITNQKERRNILKEAGMYFINPNALSTEELNDLEYERMKEKGFI